MPIQNEFLNSIISIGFIFEVKIVLTFFLTIHFIKKKESFKKELQISSSIYSEQEKEIGVGVGGGIKVRNLGPGIGNWGPIKA